MSQQEAVLCPACNAENPAGRTTCWICHAKLSGAEPVVYAELAEQPKAQTERTFFVLLTLACFAAAILVGIGLAADGADRLIPYVVVLAPAMLITGVRAFAMRSSGQPVSGGRLVLTFITSVAITIATLIVLAAVAIIALVAYLLYFCSQILGGH